MMCTFTLKKQANCSEYSLNVEFCPNDTYINRRYQCPLKNITDNQCDCIIEVKSGFLSGEDSTVTLIRNGLIQGTPRIINTAHNIKLKTPTITNVTQTTAAGTRVTWRTNYEESKVVLPSFTERLGTELYFKAKNTDEWDKVREEAIHKTHHELYLKPNTEYIIKARTYFSINNLLKLSDWSGEFIFDTSVSGKDITKKVAPVLCVILVFIICTLACCYVKIKKEWWNNKSSTPKVGPIDHPKSQEYMILNPEKIQTFTMVVDILKTDITEEEKSLAVFSVSGSSGNFSNTESMKSTPGDYGLACHVEGQKDTQLLERVRLAFLHDMEQARQIQLDQVPKTLEYEGVGSQESEQAPSPSYGQSTSASFNNRCYSAHTSPSECQSFFTSSISSDHGYHSDESVGSPVLDVGSKCDVTLTPLIQTELDYRSCDGCLISKVEPLSQLTGDKDLSAAGEADERFAKAGGQALSTCVDQGKGKDSLQGVVSGKDLLQPCLTQECDLILCEDDYRPFRV
ncbi:hypothetical protein ACEWY4_002567 [Coilia grayii]|uniref:Interleukin-4 receptor subunit alpha n=1 Tax=Coilia grayii TaxID=363190 RepID=A0ABD1KP74_9TELE